MFTKAVFAVLILIFLIDIYHCQLNCGIGTFYADKYNTCIPCPPSCLKNDTKEDDCDTLTGRCQYGCTYGMYGDKCTSHCSFACKNGTCARETGICLYGCWMGYIGPRCDRIGITIYGQDQMDENTTTMTPLSMTRMMSSSTSSTEFPRTYLPQMTRKHVTVDDSYSNENKSTSVVDTDEAFTSDKDTNNSGHHVYVYIGLSVGIVVLIAVIITMLGIFCIRNKKSSKQNAHQAPGVHYAPTCTYNYVDQNDVTELTQLGNHGNQEPITDDMYDYISENAVNRYLPSRDSINDGYLKPTTTTFSSNDTYLTLVYEKHYETPLVHTNDSTTYSVLDTDVH